MPGRARYRTGHDELDERIAELVEATGVTDNADLVFEMITSAVRMGREDADRGDLKLVNAALKELRYSFLVFQPYVGVPKVSIFGSARTTRTDPAYRLAHDFAQRIVEHQWMVITGAGPGIMEAGIAGAGTDHSFGVNIVLPFEQEATPLIAGDPKLINYRSFFTRKITFMKESRAFVLLPGGFGTMDEGFELFTLMQTGRTPLVPVVLLDEPGSTYWTAWLDFVRNELGGRGLISDHDISLVRLTQDIDDAVDEICSFYSTYHSMRFVGRRLVLRLQRELTDGELAGLDRDFGDIVTSGGYQRVAASPSEVEDQDVPDLPRIAFRFDRSSYNRLRHLINRLNGRD
ncbi:MAG: LOG family protein [Acidimicrobiales bacterium]